MLLRFLEWLLAAIVAAGMLIMGYVLVAETLETRELLLMSAAIPVMGLFIWAVVGPPLRGWWKRGAMAVFAVSLIVIFGVMVGESRSFPSWAGLLLFANLAGITICLRGRPALSGR